MFINGKWLEAQSGLNFQSFNPATGEAIGQVPAGEGIDATNAIDSAATAFEKWSTLTAYQRSDFLYEAHALMMERLEGLATIMTEEQGKPIQAARNEVKYGADFLLWYAEEANPGKREISRDKYLGGVFKFPVFKVPPVFLFFMTAFKE